MQSDCRAESWVACGVLEVALVHLDFARDELPRLFEVQRAASARGAPDYECRMQALGSLRDALRSQQAELIRAVSDDFGGRAHEETSLLELLPLYDQISHARRHLKGWMRRRKVGHTWFLRPSRAFVQYQPLGVAGVIGAWNYQLAVDARTCGRCDRGR